MQKITEELLKAFEQQLRLEEKSNVTVKKYVRDVRHFAAFVGEKPVDKDLLLQYKAQIEQQYAVAGANSMLAALNAFFRFVGCGELCVKHLRSQRKVYCSADKELTRAEYLRLIKTACTQGKVQIALILQTLCATGIRISELQYITVEAAQKGETTVNCKGKQRTIFIIPALREKLLCFAVENGVESGCVFTTRNGTPVDRSNVWRDMKNLCEAARVLPEKVYPHNLRHLFARTFYGVDKDIAKLADMLGHSNINTTRIYILTTGEEHRKRMESMHLLL